MSKTIGIFHFQVGRTDGVSLEIDKWRRVLEGMGHTVHLCAGDIGTADGATLIEEMYHHREDAHRLYHNTFVALDDYDGDAAYRAELYERADVLEAKFRAFIEEKGIDFIIPQNVWSVAAHPSVAIAIARVMRDLQIPALAHNHDFYFERTTGVALTCKTAVELADLYLPPRDPLARHVVINSLGQRQLLTRKGLPSTVVPNIFDFEEPPWTVDDYNRDFRERIGLKENDILVLQATRIVERKGIELAVDVVEALGSPERRAQLAARGLFDGRTFDDDRRIVFVLAGYARDDTTGGYVRRLKERIARAGIDVLFIEDIIDSSRDTRDGQKIYALWDTYVFADLVTYPSLWEGWGNQLLEAVYARQPIVIYEYPVFKADIKGNGFEILSLGDEVAGRDDLGLVEVAPEVIEAAADEAVVVLTNGEARDQMVERNFQIGREHYSMAALEKYLGELVGK